MLLTPTSDTVIRPWDRNEVLPQILDELRGMIYNFARNHGLDFDDCLQDASVIMLEVWPRLPEDCTYIKNYLGKCVRVELYRRLPLCEKEKAVSLDAPISPDSNETFADMLADTLQIPDTERQDFIAKTLHAALQQCRWQEQLYAKERYQLNSFDPVPSTIGLEDITYYGQRSNMSMRHSITLRVKRNPQVLALLH